MSPMPESDAKTPGKISSRVEIIVHHEIVRNAVTICVPSDMFCSVVNGKTKHSKVKYRDS